MPLSDVLARIHPGGIVANIKKRAQTAAADNAPTGNAAVDLARYAGSAYPAQPSPSVDTQRSEVLNSLSPENPDISRDLDEERRRRIRMMGSRMPGSGPLSASYQSLMNSNGNMY